MLSKAKGVSAEKYLGDELGRSNISDEGKDPDN